MEESLFEGVPSEPEYGSGSFEDQLARGEWTAVCTFETHWAHRGEFIAQFKPLEECKEKYGEENVRFEHPYHLDEDENVIFEDNPASRRTVYVNSLALEALEDSQPA